MASNHAFFVLVGGEAFEWQGVEAPRRELLHTSLQFVGIAYEKLRSAGIPREQIITIVQLADTLDVYDAGIEGTLGNGIPPVVYVNQKKSIEESCGRLMAEGGADYDYKFVNPGTLWSVLLGEEVPGATEGKVVKNASSLFFGIYSHGDSHHVEKGGKDDDPLKNEWFAHMPYPTSSEEMYEFVATEGAVGYGKSRPMNYFYATQLYAVLARLFAEDGERPVVGLLNFCRSGGNLNFMRREGGRKHMRTDEWPLFLMSSSQAGTDSLVAGLWEAWFDNLGVALQEGGEMSLQDLYQATEEDYRERNKYEFLDTVKTLAYPDLGADIGEDNDPWHVDLSSLLTRGPHKTPDFKGLAALQKEYRSGKRFGKKVYINHPYDWRREVDLVKQVKAAQKRVAVPDSVHGEKSGVLNIPLSVFLS